MPTRSSEDKFHVPDENIGGMRKGLAKRKCVVCGHQSIFFVWAAAETHLEQKSISARRSVIKAVIVLRRYMTCESLKEPIVGNSQKNVQ